MNNFSFCLLMTESARFCNYDESWVLDWSCFFKNHSGRESKQD